MSPTTISFDVTCGQLKSRLTISKGLKSNHWYVGTFKATGPRSYAKKPTTISQHATLEEAHAAALTHIGNALSYQMGLAIIEAAKAEPAPTPV